MTTSRYTADDYTGALQSLLPTGRVWPKHPDSVQGRVLSALAQSYQRVDSSAVGLIKGGFPATALALLPEWEETMNLPNLCSISEMKTIYQRQQAIVSRLIGKGNLSTTYYIAVAAALGYDITITLFRQARAGFSVCGDAINGENWPYVWRVNAAQTTYVQASCGRTYCGDPLSTWGNKILECTLTAISPPYTKLIFSYS